MPELQKPPFCIIEGCQVIHNNAYPPALADGQSCMCCGQNDGLMVWQAGNTTHPNDLNFCIYTPFKGWLRFVMCEPDIEMMSCMAWAIARFTAKKIRLYGPDGAGYIDEAKLAANPAPIMPGIMPESYAEKCAKAGEPRA